MRASLSGMADNSCRYKAGKLCETTQRPTHPVHCLPAALWHRGRPNRYVCAGLPPATMNSNAADAARHSAAGGAAAIAAGLELQEA